MLGDESTTGREEQQYSCDVEICGRNQEPEFDALETKEDEGVAKKGTRMSPEMKSGSNGLILYGEDSPISKVIFMHFFSCINQSF